MTPTPRYQPALDVLLADAARAYRSRDDAAFRRLLEEAAALSPERIDVLNCLASHHVQVGRPEAALAIYRDISTRCPGDADNLFRLAHWQRFSGDAAGADATRSALAAMRPDLADWLTRLWTSLDRWFARPVSDDLPDAFGQTGKAAIVILGYVLADDGSAQPRLLTRLEKGLEAARRFPDASVIVSGGVPKAGRVEATVMRYWLAERGVEARRIWEEGYSRDCVENLIYSFRIMMLSGIEEALIVTAAGNVRRIGASMEVLSALNGWTGGVRVVSSSAEFADYADDGSDRLKAYRETLRAYGMPMMASYPHLVER